MHQKLKISYPPFLFFLRLTRTKRVQANKKCMPRSSPRIADSIAPDRSATKKTGLPKGLQSSSVLRTSACVQCFSLTLVLYFIPTFGCRTPDTPSSEERERREKGLRVSSSKGLLFHPMDPDLTKCRDLPTCERRPMDSFAGKVTSGSPFPGGNR